MLAQKLVFLAKKPQKNNKNVTFEINIQFKKLQTSKETFLQNITFQNR